MAHSRSALGGLCRPGCTVGGAGKETKGVQLAPAPSWRVFREHTLLSQANPDF